MKSRALSAKTFTLTAVLAVSAFSSSVSAKDWKSIAIATEGAYEPWNMTSPDGTLIGFEPELMANLCQRMKIQCKLIAQDWDGMIAGLNLGKFDVIMDGIAVSAERRKEIAFTIPYANTPAAFVTAKKGSLANLPGTGQEVSLTGNAAADKPVLEGFRAAFKGKSIGIQAGTSFTSFIYDNFKDIARIREYKTAPAHDLDLKAGRVDVVFDDVSYFISALARPENQNLAFTGPKIGGPIWDIGEAFGLRHADSDLKAKFDEAIEAALTDGAVKKLSERWFHGYDITPKK